MHYSLDLSRIPLATYQTLLANQNLLPGRRILLDGLHRNFETLSAEHIETLLQLKQRLSAPPKLAALAAATGISVEYLTILKREIGSLEQKPVQLSAFPGLDETLLASLRELGIVTSKDGFEHQEANSELFCLCDLARINGVGGVAARAFYEAGYRGVADVAAASAAEMLARVSAANDEHGYYKAKLGEKDMQFCIDFARLMERFS